MTTRSGPAAARVSALVLLPVLSVVMVGAGLLITGPAGERWPLSAESAVNAWFATHRTSAATAVSEWLTLIASTECVISVALLCVIGLVVVPRVPAWREAVFVAASVTTQSLIFVVVTLCVERPRPDVPQLDPAPPTSSFPSGHVGASLALYGGLAVLAVTRLRGPWRYAAAGMLLVIAPAVALSRLYRGMHHPSDVVGGLVNGACVLFVMVDVLLKRGPSAPTRATSDRRPTCPSFCPGPEGVCHVVVGGHGGTYSQESVKHVRCDRLLKQPHPSRRRPRWQRGQQPQRWPGACSPPPSAG
jgi:membrane-associated phospholipid phosphatase